MEQTKSELLLNQVTNNENLILQNKKEIGFYIEYTNTTIDGEQFYTIFRDMKVFGQNRINVTTESKAGTLSVIKSQGTKNWEVKESSYVTRHPILNMI